jgi:hypothetical protein
MIITNNDFRTIRFEFNGNPIGSVISIKSRTEVGFDKNILWIGLRWNVNIVSDTEDEIFGMLSEERACVVTEDENRDLDNLRLFVLTSFRSLEEYYRDTAPPQYAQILIPIPDVESVSIALLKDLKDIGAYTSM